MAFKGGTPQDVTKNVLQTHLETTATGEEIRQMKNLKNTYTVFENGDLSKPEGRNDFSLRVDRTRSAVYEVLKCQGQWFLTFTNCPKSKIFPEKKPFFPQSLGLFRSA